VFKEDCIMYVPILQTIQALLSNEAIVSEVGNVCVQKRIFICLYNRLSVGMEVPLPLLMITVMERVS